MVGGASSGGVLVAAVGPGWGLAIDAGAFFVSALCFSFIRLDPTDRLGQANMLLELREGWDAFRSRTWLWVVVAAFGVINAAHAAGWYTLRPVIADQTFGRQGWGFVLAAETGGMFLAGLVLLRVRFRRPLFVGMLGVLAWSPLMLALGMQPGFAVLVAISLVGGAGVELFGVGWDLSVQQHVPPHLLSRVYAYDALGSFVAIPVGQVLAGPLAAVVGRARRSSRSASSLRRRSSSPCSSRQYATSSASTPSPRPRRPPSRAAAPDSTTFGTRARTSVRVGAC